MGAAQLRRARCSREQAGRFLRTLKNVYSGIFAQYANFGWSPSDAGSAARRAADHRSVDALAARDAWSARWTPRCEAYDATTAARAIIEFVDDDLANWYVRLNRGRFYDTEGDDNRAAFATLHEVLVSVCRLLAPFAPFVSDWMHRELTGDSVHLAPFVRADGPSRWTPTLDAAMSAVRTLARLGRAAREEAGIKVRQPLSRMVCVAPNVPEAALEPLLPLLAAELNVKQVEFASSRRCARDARGEAEFPLAGQEVWEEDAVGGGGGCGVRQRASYVLFLHGDASGR